MNFRLFLLMTLVFSGCGKNKSIAQCTTNSTIVISPEKYWNFNTPEAWGKSKDGKAGFGISKNVEIGKEGNNGYLALRETDEALSVKNEKGLSWNTNILVYEFRFRFNENYSPLLISLPNAAINIDFAGIQFNASYSGSGNAKGLKAKMKVDFNGIDRKSFSYYTDREFHHFVAKTNYNTHVMEVWIDGQMIQKDEKALPVDASPLSLNEGEPLINVHNKASVHPTRRFLGDIDDIAIYTRDVPKTLIYKHYLSVKNNESEWDFTDNFKSSCIPAESALLGTLNPMDFAPKNLNKEMGVIEQFNTFPLPRFKQGHTLLRNALFIDLEAMTEPNAGVALMMNQPGYSSKKHNASYVQLQLAQNWNYYLSIPSIPVVEKPEIYTRFCDTNSVNGKFLLNAKMHPELPVSTTIFQKQNFAKQSQKVALTPVCGKGGFYICEGDNPVTINGKRYSFSPLAPSEAFRDDGIAYKNALLIIKSSLNRPIDLFICNGEMIAGIATPPTDKEPEGNGGIMEKDSKIVQDYNQWNPSGFAKNWYTYDSEKRMKRFTIEFRDAFLKSNELESANLIKTSSKFTQYQIGGDWSNYRMNYPIVRQLMTPFNGKYYATENFYPFYPKYWNEFSAGSINSIGRMRKSLETTLAAGDKFYSPFIDPYAYTSPVWEETGTLVSNQINEGGYTPAQWLGLLKYLSVTGAEFFYNFYYRQCPDKGIGCREHGNEYAWMTTTPAYVQAIVSRYENIFRNGNVMEGNHPAGSGKYPADYKYTFHAKDDRILVGVRKSGLQYVISGNINPIANVIENAPSDGVAEINLEGETLLFNVRRQGSVYVYDKSVNPPVFYQLDRWHEASHPYYWSKNFRFDAVLFDNSTGTIGIKTEQITTSGGVTDTRNAISYIALPSNATISYYFQPNLNGSARYKVSIKARSKSGSGSIQVLVDNVNKGSVTVNNSSWQILTLGQKISGITLNQEHNLSVLTQNQGIEISEIILEAE